MSTEEGVGVTLDLVGLTSQAERLAAGKAEAEAEVRHAEDEKAGAVVEVNRRVFLRAKRGAAFEEVSEGPILDDGEYLKPLTVATIDALCEWAKEASESGDGELRLSRSAQSWAMTPRRVSRLVRRDICTMDFFNDFLPPGDCSLLAWRGWLDGLEGVLGVGVDAQGSEAVIGRELLDLALNKVTATDSDTVRFEMVGAVIQFKTESESQVRPGGEFPRVIEAVLPFGDPGFRVRARFLVTISKPRGSGVRVHTELQSPERLRDLWVDWARQRIAASGLTWPVFETR